MTTTLTSIRTTSSAFIRKAASETGAFFIRNKKTAIITGTSVLVGAAIIAGGTIFAVNSLNTGLTIKGAPAAAATATPKVTAAPVAAPTPAAPAQVGDTLDSDTALGFRRDMPASGDYAYKLGAQWVKINRFQPLPAAVQADVDAKAAAAPRTTGTTFADGTAGTKNATALVGQIQYATGKKVIFISVQLTASGATNVPTYLANGALTPAIVAGNAAGGWATAAAAKAAVEASVATQPDADNYVVVVQS